MTHLVWLNYEPDEDDDNNPWEVDHFQLLDGGVLKVVNKGQYTTYLSPIGWKRVDKR